MQQKRYIFYVDTLDTQLFDISANKTRKISIKLTELINWSTTEPSHYMPYNISHKHHTTSHYKPKRK